MSGGRRPLGDPSYGHSKVLNFKIAHEQLELLKLLKEQSGRTPSEIVRTALERYLAEELKGAPQAS
jgi:predicted DNA-binding protein